MSETVAIGASGEAPIVGAVLVGGDSRRMGRDKARLEHAGRSLADRAADALEQALGEVVLVARDPGEWRGSGRRVVADQASGQGPLAGLHAALLAASSRPVFVLACDLPRVGPELVRHLVAEAPAPGGGPWAAVARLGLTVQPLCGLYAAACLLPLGSFLARGGRRVLDFLGLVRTIEVAIEPDAPFYRPDLLENLNTPEDLARWLGAPSGAGSPG